MAAIWLVTMFEGKRFFSSSSIFLYNFSYGETFFAFFFLTKYLVKIFGDQSCFVDGM